MITIILSVSLSVVVLLSFFIIRNLILTNEKLEDIVSNQNTYVEKLSNVVKQSSNKLQEVDNKGTFKSDDEVGFFFNTLKKLQNILDDFKVE